MALPFRVGLCTVGAFRELKFPCAISSVVALCKQAAVAGCNSGQQVRCLFCSQAIRDAKYLTYTYSWDFSHTLRNPPDDTSMQTIGEILKAQAEAGAIADDDNASRVCNARISTVNAAQRGSTC